MCGCPPCPALPAWEGAHWTGRQCRYKCVANVRPITLPASRSAKLATAMPCRPEIDNMPLLLPGSAFAYAARERVAGRASWPAWLAGGLAAGRPSPVNRREGWSVWGHPLGHPLGTPPPLPLLPDRQGDGTGWRQTRGEERSHLNSVNNVVLFRPRSVLPRKFSSLSFARPLFTSPQPPAALVGAHSLPPQPPTLPGLCCFRFLRAHPHPQP